MSAHNGKQNRKRQPKCNVNHCKNQKNQNPEHLLRIRAPVRVAAIPTAPSAMPIEKMTIAITAVPARNFPMIIESR